MVVGDVDGGGGICVGVGVIVELLLLWWFCLFVVVLWLLWVLSVMLALVPSVTIVISEF